MSEAKLNDLLAEELWCEYYSKHNRGWLRVISDSMAPLIETNPVSPDQVKPWFHRMSPVMYHLRQQLASPLLNYPGAVLSISLRAINKLLVRTTRYTAYLSGQRMTRNQLVSALAKNRSD